MDTLDTEAPATQEPLVDTPAPETTDETAASDTSEDGQQEDAATLRKRLADKDRLITELRAKPKEEKPDTRSKEIQELEWKLENKERIALVKDEFDRILTEGFQGEKVTKKVALELAEKLAKVDRSVAKRDRQDDMSVTAVTNRNVDPKGYESEADKALGLTLEKKRKLEAKHPHLNAA